MWAGMKYLFFYFVFSVMQDVASKSERGRKIEQAMSQTRKAVGKMLSSMNGVKR